MPRRTGSARLSLGEDDVSRCKGVEPKTPDEGEQLLSRESREQRAPQGEGRRGHLE